MNNPHPAHQGTYVVTCDAAVQRGFYRSLLSKIRDQLPDINVNSIRMAELRRAIWAEARSSLLQCAIISISPQIAVDPTRGSKALCLDVNRLFGRDGNHLIGYGCRPGSAPIATQLTMLVRAIAGRPVILIEDGAFSGGTIAFVVAELARFNVEVIKVILGVCCARARRTIAHSFRGEIFVTHPINDVMDWIPDIDLLPFFRNCGRVLGRRNARCCIPSLTRDGFSMSFPFIYPFGDMEKWASLPDPSRMISRLCLETSFGFFQRGYRQVTVRQLISMNAGVSIPIAVKGQPGGRLFPETKVVDFLGRVRDILE